MSKVSTCGRYPFLSFLAVIIACFAAATPRLYAQELSSQQLRESGAPRSVWIEKLREETGMYAGDEETLLEAAGVGPVVRDPKEQREAMDAIKKALMGPQPGPEIEEPQPSYPTAAVELPAAAAVEPTSEANGEFVWPERMGGTMFLIGAGLYLAATLWPDAESDYA